MTTDADDVNVVIMESCFVIITVYSILLLFYRLKSDINHLILLFVLPATNCLSTAGSWLIFMIFRLGVLR